VLGHDLPNRQRLWRAASFHRLVPGKAEGTGFTPCLLFGAELLQCAAGG